MQAASLDTLPTLKILETDIVIGPAIMSKCPSLVDLFLEDPDDDAVFARALKETTKLPSLHKLEMHHSALVDKGTIEGTWLQKHGDERRTNEWCNKVSPRHSHSYENFTFRQETEPFVDSR